MGDIGLVKWMVYGWTKHVFLMDRINGEWVNEWMDRVVREWVNEWMDRVVREINRLIVCLWMLIEVYLKL